MILALLLDQDRLRQSGNNTFRGLNSAPKGLSSLGRIQSCLTDLPNVENWMMYWLLTY